jgi:hypothetical protein
MKLSDIPQLLSDVSAELQHCVQRLDRAQANRLLEEREYELSEQRYEDDRLDATYDLPCGCVAHVVKKWIPQWRKRVCEVNWTHQCDTHEEARRVA